MKYTTLAFLLSLTLGGLAAPVFAAEDNNTALAITASQMQTIHWQSVQAGENVEFDMNASGQNLSLNQISAWPARTQASWCARARHELSRCLRVLSFMPCKTRRR